MWALVAEDSAVNISDSRRIETCRHERLHIPRWAAHLGSLLLDAVPLGLRQRTNGTGISTITAEISIHSLRKNAGLVNRLDTQPETQPKAKEVLESENPAEVVDLVGGPTRIRTCWIHKDVAEDPRCYVAHGDSMSVIVFSPVDPC